MGLVILSADRQICEMAIQQRADRAMANKQYITFAMSFQHGGGFAHNASLRVYGAFPAGHGLAWICEESIGHGFKFHRRQKPGR